MSTHTCRSGGLSLTPYIVVSQRPAVPYVLMNGPLSRHGQRDGNAEKYREEDIEKNGWRMEIERSRHSRRDEGWNKQKGPYLPKLNKCDNLWRRITEL